ncbi:DUF4158 domain-containing protein [Rhodococcus sp. WB9]|uniref:DUF4158 domain-containing protein n=1 Tax=Rhodococcus sp. WB9 TaxID=2594007 RepID=UPI0021B38F76|nr:DUF4158 domain-containing protein [Rhodococcus sp. WB9]
MASIDRTAYPRFKRVVSAQELAEAFTPTPDEVAWAREKTQSDPHLLALAVRLKAYQRLGYFPKLYDIPAVVVDTVRGVLDLPGGVNPETDADRTAKRHRKFVREYLGVRYEAAKVRAVAEQAIRAAAATKDNPADLINVALEELVRARCELPGYTTLDAMAATIRAEVNGEFFALVSGRPAWAERARLDRLLVVDPATRRSEFDRIKTPVQAATVGKFKARLAHVQALDAIGPTEAWLDGVPPGKVAHFAGEARVAGVDDMRKTGEAKRVTLLVALVHQQRVEARDEVVTMFCKRMAALHKKGRERLEELREAHRAETERPNGPGGCCSRHWTPPVGWSSCPRRTRRCRRITATTTCRCWSGFTARTARRCSHWSTPWTWCPRPRIAACWTRWSSFVPTATGAVTGSRRRPPTAVTDSSTRSPWTSTHSRA